MSSCTKTTVQLSIVLTNQLLTVELPMLEIIQQWQYFTVPHIVRSDSASPVEMTGAWSLSSQSLLKSENDRNSLSGWTPVDFDQTMTRL